MNNFLGFTFLSLVISIVGCSSEPESEPTTSVSVSDVPAAMYVPVDQEMHDQLVRLDSVFFTAYNNCDLETQASLVSEDLEFFHDQGGLLTKKEELMEGIKLNICGKVTRELVPGSIEVYPIPNYGAVQMGMHQFHNSENPEGTVSAPSKFVAIWKQDSVGWQMTRIISLH